MKQGTAENVSHIISFSLLTSFTIRFNTIESIVITQKQGTAENASHIISFSHLTSFIIRFNTIESIAITQKQGTAENASHIISFSYFHFLLLVLIGISQNRGTAKNASHVIFFLGVVCLFFCVETSKGTFKTLICLADIFTIGLTLVEDNDEACNENYKHDDDREDDAVGSLLWEAQSPRLDALNPRLPPRPPAAPGAPPAPPAAPPTPQSSSSSCSCSCCSPSFMFADLGDNDGGGDE